MLKTISERKLYGIKKAQIMGFFVFIDKKIIRLQIFYFLFLTRSNQFAFQNF